MITLYSFGPGFGLPDPSPFVTKVEVLLKMAKLPYRTDTTGFTKAPKGKLPYIEDDGVMVSDSTFIRWHIEQKYRIDFDQGLDASQKAIAWAFEKMVEDQLYWVMIDDRWMDDANFRRGPATQITITSHPRLRSSRSFRAVPLHVGVELALPKFSTRLGPSSPRAPRVSMSEAAVNEDDLAQPGKELVRRTG